MAKKASVSLGSVLDITQVEALKDRLQAALDKNLDVTLVADKVEKADTAGLQLVYSFIKQLEANGLSAHWQKPTDTINEVSQILGMSKLLNLA